MAVSIETILFGVGKVAGFLPMWLGPVARFGVWMEKVAGFVLTFGGSALKIGSLITGWLGPLARFVLPFAKLLGPIGWIITAFQTISSLIKHFTRFFRGEESFGQALWGVIDDILIAPFRKAWDWISSIFVGNSPSKLALGIVKGIVSVSSMLFDALTYPWRHFLAWIADKIPGMGGIAKKLRGGMGGALEDMGILEKKAAPPEIQPLAVATEATPVPTATVTTVPTAEEKTRRDADSTTLGNILSALNTLNSNLSAGKIGVYIDGQLMSATLARQTAFRGGYGMNQV